jgi:hypothetical protein
MGKLSKLSPNDLRNVVQHLPKDVRYQMTRNYNTLFVGGGFVRAIVAGEKPSDIDMFGHSKDKLTTVSFNLGQDRPGSKLHTSNNAITLLANDRLPVQFITRWLFNSAEELVKSFDFTVCQAVVYYNKETKQWDSAINDNFYQDLAARRLVYTFPVREEEAGGSMLRVMKYVKRGYNIQIDSLAGVMSRIAAKVCSHELSNTENQDEKYFTTHFKAELREVDPLLVIDGLDVVDDHHETDLEAPPTLPQVPSMFKDSNEF